MGGTAPVDAIRWAAAAATSAFLACLALAGIGLWRGRIDLIGASLAALLAYVLVGAQWFNPWYLLWVAPFAALAGSGRLRLPAVVLMLLAPLVYPLEYATWPIMWLVFAPTAVAWGLSAFSRRISA